MLQAIRDKAQGWIAWVIVGFISIPFALWGIQEYIGVSGEQVAAKVAGSEITQKQLESSVERFRSQLREVFGGKIPEAYTDEALRKQVLDGMISDDLVSGHAEQQGIRAGDGMVREEIRNYPTFQKDGKFDADLYKSSLLQQGRSPAMFENLIRQDISVDVLRRAVSDTSVVSDAELDSYLSLKEQQRLISYLVVTNSQDADSELVSDADVRAWYDANPANYMRPEQVRLEYLELSRDIIAKDISIDPAAIQTYYDEHKQSWTADEKRSMRHILFTVDSKQSDAEAKAAAEAVLAQLHDGADFAQLAREHSADPGSANAGGDLGVVDKGVMVKPFEDAAFALEKGQISELVRSRFGYHIIEVTDIQGGGVKPLADVEESIRTQLQQDEAERLFYDYAEQLANIAYDSPDSLEPAAEALGLKVQESDWLARSGNPEGIGTPKVMLAAFGDDVKQQGFNSEVIELDTERVVVVRMQEHREVATRPFDEVTDLIRQQLELKAKSEIASKKAAALLARLEAGETIDVVAQDENLDVEADKQVSRDTSDIPSAIISAAFALQQSGDQSAYTTAALVTGNHAVIELKSVTDGDVAATSEAARNELRKQFADTRGKKALSAYIEWLRDTNEIEILSE
ncbi:SurA N-terminal domain-containing protein [Solemya elarraichensis gill symbiont]|uniref:Periplasmic chaperone PpiD n=1 Tax=Solemya elarraichensis gill symbiont TaxID=1918949 RepID=A0A1T2LC01_9GAMM|nr:SurA N-terminal domain-containing protein [Solemya elarraichensis gill symbiont]OOZ42552.1 hypothetical protein BOW52_02600 [Solemya elarraichensis gill symbiont]